MANLNMLPAFPEHNIRNVCGGYIEFFGQLASRVSKYAKPSNVKHIDVCKAMIGRCLAFTAIVSGSTLIGHIPLIVGNSANVQMTGINTGPVVAFMHNNKSVRDLPSKEFIGHPVGSLGLSIPYLPISAITYTSRPFPTRVKWNHLNLIHKPVNKSSLHGGVL